MTDQLARTIQKAGGRIKTGWGDFDKKVYLRSKILVNVFSAPGVGKSMWAINLAARVRVPVLYITIDTPLATQALRWWALIGDRAISDVERRPRAAMRRAIRAPSGATVEWCDTPLGADDVPALLAAVSEYWGEPPRVVIVDVIGDLLSERSYESYTSAFASMKRIAHRFGSTVITLHHATKNVDPEEPLYLRDVEYAGDKQPDVVIGMFIASRRTVVAEILKNRLGQASPNGSIEVRFKVDFARARLEEW